MEPGKIIHIPEFIYNGKTITDPDNLLGEIMTVIDSKSKRTKYLKVKMFSPVDNVYRYMVIVRDKSGKLTTPPIGVQKRFNKKLVKNQISFLS